MSRCVCPPASHPCSLYIWNYIGLLLYLSGISWRAMISMWPPFPSLTSMQGFPCNQFGAQEPGSNNQIKTFATKWVAPLNLHLGGTALAFNGGVSSFRLRSANTCPGHALCTVILSTSPRMHGPRAHPIRTPCNLLLSRHHVAVLPCLPQPVQGHLPSHVQD